MDPDWSLLLPEVVQLISEKIAFVEHYVCFRLVCRPWRLACPPRPRHLIGKFPWIIGDPNAINPCTALTLSLYDFSESRVHNFNLPDPIYSYGDIRGSSHGWIVLQNGTELSLINPITGEKKSNCFPSFAAPPNILGFARNERSNYSRPSCNFDACKVILTSSPSDKDCIAVARFLSNTWELAFSRIGDTCWTILKLREFDDGGINMVAFECKKDLVYAIDEKGYFTIYGLGDLSKKVIVNNLRCPSHHNSHFNIVLGKGELDGVPIIVNALPNNEFNVFKCVNEPSGYEWTRVRNIGNYVLFLYYGMCEMISLDYARLNGWERNHICCMTGSYRNEQMVLRMVDIENDCSTFNMLHVPVDFFCSNMYGRFWLFTASLW